MPTLDRISMDKTQSLVGKTGGLHNIEKPIANVGIFPQKFNIYSHCEGGIGLDEYEQAMEEIAGMFRSEGLRGEMIKLAIAQVDNVDLLGQLSQAEYTARASHSIAEQKRQNWLAEEQNIIASEHRVAEATHRASEAEWKAEAAKWKASAAEVNASTAGVGLDSALVGFQDAALALLLRRSKLAVTRDRGAAELVELRQQVDDIQEKLGTHARKATVRLGSAVNVPKVDAFAVPDVQFANIQAPSAADAIKIPGVSKGMPGAGVKVDNAA